MGMVDRIHGSDLVGGIRILGEVRPAPHMHRGSLYCSWGTT